MWTPFYLLTFSQRERFIQFDYCTPRFFHNNLAKTCVILHAFRILRRNLSYMATYTHHRIGLSEEILIMSIFWTMLHLPLTLIIILWSSDYMLVLTRIFMSIFINHMNLHVLKHFFFFTCSIGKWLIAHQNWYDDSIKVRLTQVYINHGKIISFVAPHKSSPITLGEPADSWLRLLEYFDSMKCIDGVKINSYKSEQ